MANKYFQFKQFLVKQDKCAMKVCTDSCILGAYAQVETANSILDIGTGTGLLALMAAQRSNAQIEAIEIDPAAAAQALENTLNSPWKANIQIHDQSLQEFAITNTQKFDVIICNPPFYQASQKSLDAGRNKAMHQQEITFAEILLFCNTALSPAGKLYILLPPAESNIFTELATVQSLYLDESLEIFTSTTGKYFRSIRVLSLIPNSKPSTKTLFIRQPDNTYTDDFIRLLKPYYLHL